MHRLEYATILLIVAAMGLVGFTEGIILGIILANVFFVVMYARRPVVRSLYNGSQLRSTVHRLYRQQIFLDKVGSQICIIRLQGFIFFGTINQCELCRGLADFLIVNDQIRTVTEGSSRIRFLVMDFSLISGIDYSAMVFLLDASLTYTIGIVSKDLQASRRQQHACHFLWNGSYCPIFDHDCRFGWRRRAWRIIFGAYIWESQSSAWMVRKWFAVIIL